MNKIIKTLKNGDFKVVSTSYDIPVNYIRNTKLQSGMDSGEHTNGRRRKIYKHSIHRDS